MSSRLQNLPHTPLIFNFQYPRKCKFCPKELVSSEQEDKHLRRYHSK